MKIINVDLVSKMEKINKLNESRNIEMSVAERTFILVVLISCMGYFVGHIMAMLVRGM